MTDDLFTTSFLQELYKCNMKSIKLNGELWTLTLHLNFRLKIISQLDKFNKDESMDYLRSFNFLDFLYALSLVVSRAFEISDSKEMVMLPFADLFNHSRTGFKVAWRAKLPKGYTAFSKAIFLYRHFILHFRADIMSGEELTVCYHSSTVVSRLERNYY